MRIDEISLREVGPFDDARIEFPPGSDPTRADVYLLTGPNGSGKSTVLYALAGALTAGNAKSLSPDLGAARMRTANSVYFVRAGEECLAAAWRVAANSEREKLDLGTSVAHAVLHGTTGFSYFATRPARELNSYIASASDFISFGPIGSEAKFAWAAFAYAGVRTVADVQVTNIEEPTDSPFAQSLSFLHTANASRFAHWVANQDFKRLKAKEAGRHDKAAALRASISHVERVVSEIIDAPFSFVTSYDDNNVRAKVGDRVIDLGLLPDGLKSIVSWVADLLMRLDRIPWVDDTPPQDRAFLLLLDEVDIHLHPAWQRKVLPIVQRLFPNAQIIASTHSPFVVASAVDARIISLGLRNGVATVDSNEPANAGASYSAILRSVFGIASEFDVDTEAQFQRFHELKQRVIAGEADARAALDLLIADLAGRSEEVREIIALEKRQLDRQLARKAA